MNSRYDEPPSAGNEQQNIPTFTPDTRTGGIRKTRAVVNAELTLDITYVSGPEATSLARTQYEAIKEILQWLHTNHPDQDAA